MYESFNKIIIRDGAHCEEVSLCETIPTHDRRVNKRFNPLLPLSVTLVIVSNLWESYARIY